MAGTEKGTLCTSFVLARHVSEDAVTYRSIFVPLLIWQSTCAAPRAPTHPSSLGHISAHDCAGFPNPSAQFPETYERTVRTYSYVRTVGRPEG